MIHWQTCLHLGAFPSIPPLTGCLPTRFIIILFIPVVINIIIIIIIVIILISNVQAAHDGQSETALPDSGSHLCHLIVIIVIIVIITIIITYITIIIIIIRFNPYWWRLSTTSPPSTSASTSCPSSSRRSTWRKGFSFHFQPYQPDSSIILTRFFISFLVRTCALFRFGFLRFIGIVILSILGTSVTYILLGR